MAARYSRQSGQNASASLASRSITDVTSACRRTWMAARVSSTSLSMSPRSPSLTAAGAGGAAIWSRGAPALASTPRITAIALVRVMHVVTVPSMGVRPYRRVRRAAMRPSSNAGLSDRAQRLGPQRLGDVTAQRAEQPALCVHQALVARSRGLGEPRAARPHLGAGAIQDAPASRQHALRVERALQARDLDQHLRVGSERATPREDLHLLARQQPGEVLAQDRRHREPERRAPLVELGHLEPVGAGPGDDL